LGFITAAQFSCDVGIDGTILISGVTITWEATIYRYSHVFEMQTRNLCPPDEFAMSFRLPGPVDSYNFEGKFGTNGVFEVFEGVVMKAKSPWKSYVVRIIFSVQLTPTKVTMNWNNMS